MTNPLKEVIQGSATLLRIAEKPLGIGLAIGLVAGGANALILGITTVSYTHLTLPTKRIV